MAVEKAVKAEEIVPMADSRAALEKAVETLEDAFSSCSKLVLKKRLKKRAQGVKFPPNDLT